MHPDWQDEIHVYCENMSSAETPFLQAINEFTWKKMINPRMLSGHLQGRFLSSMVALKQPTCIVEIGTFTGYATACLHEHLPKGSSLHSIEADAETAHKTQHFWQENHPSHQVQWHVGETLTVLPKLNLQPDFVFVDADKHNYSRYLDMCLPLMKTGGIMLFDNTLWSKRVIIEKDRESDRDTQNMHAFNAYANALPNVLVAMLPIRDGITLVTKLD